MNRKGWKEEKNRNTIPKPADSRRKQFDKYLYYKSNAPVILTAWQFFFWFVILVGACVFKKKYEEKEKQKKSALSALVFHSVVTNHHCSRSAFCTHVRAPEILFFKSELVNFSACLLPYFPPLNDGLAGLIVAERMRSCTDLHTSFLMNTRKTDNTNAPTKNQNRYETRARDVCSMQ